MSHLGMDGIFTHSLARSLAHSLDPSLRYKLCDVWFVTNAFRNKNNVNPAITTTNLL